MATGKSGYFDLTGTKGFTVRVKWSEEWDVGTNTSKVSITALQVKSTQYSSIYYLDGTLKINGVTAITFDSTMGTHAVSTSNSSGFSDVVANGSYQPAPWAVSNIAHNDDGSKNVVIAADLAGYTVSGTDGNAWKVSSSNTVVLTTIARGSQPSCITWPEHTQNVGEFGDTISIHMNRKSDVFKHTVRYQFGSRSGTCINAETGKATNKDVETGFKWKIPEDLMDLIPKDTRGSGTIYVDTYNGSTKIDTKSCGFTATVPAGVKPSCTLTLEDITGIDDIYGSPVQGLSNIQITVTETLAHSSPIVFKAISANGIKSGEEPVNTGVLKTAGDSPVRVTITDARGRSGSAEYIMNVQEYSAPTIPMLTVHRCGKDGTEDDQGEYVELLFSAQVSPLGDKNTATYAVRYKQSTSDSWTELVEDANGWKPTDLTNNFNVFNQSYIFAADGNSSYDVEVTITDNHNTTTRSTSVSTAFTLYNCHPSGTGWRFGGVAELENTLQNDLVFVQTANHYCFSSVGAETTQGYILMARLTVTGINSDTPITFVFSRRKAQAPMTVHVCFNTTSDNDPGLAFIKYEGDNYDAYLTSPAESVWDLYVKKSSGYDTITLNNWFTSYRQMQLVNVEFVGSIESTVPLGRFGYYHATPLVPRSILDCFMPVGYILTLYSQANPNDMYPGTTWVRMTNTFLWGCDANGDIGVTGGEKTHTLTVSELPAHNHGSVYSGNASGTKTHAWLASGGSAMAYGTVSAGGGAAHNNMPPYTQVAIWRRTV